MPDMKPFRKDRFDLTKNHIAITESGGGADVKRLRNSIVANRFADYMKDAHDKKMAVIEEIKQAHTKKMEEQKQAKKQNVFTTSTTTAAILSRDYNKHPADIEYNKAVSRLRGYCLLRISVPGDDKRCWIVCLNTGNLHYIGSGRSMKKPLLSSKLNYDSLEFSIASYNNGANPKYITIPKNLHGKLLQHLTDSLQDLALWTDFWTNGRRRIKLCEGIEI